MGWDGRPEQSYVDLQWMDDLDGEPSELVRINRVVKDFSRGDLAYYFGRSGRVSYTGSWKGEPGKMYKFVTLKWTDDRSESDLMEVKQLSWSPIYFVNVRFEGQRFAVRVDASALTGTRQ